MNDITKIFGDFIVDSWQVEGGLWARTEGVARDLFSSVKRSLAPGLTVMAMGAATFCAPVDVWASSFQFKPSASQSAVVSGVSPDIANHGSTVNERHQWSDSWASSEISRLRSDLAELFAQYKAGDLSGFSADLMSVATETSHIMTSENLAISDSSMRATQKSLLAEIHEPPQAKKALRIALKAIAS